MLTSWRRFAASHPRLVEAAFVLLLYLATAKQYDAPEGPGFGPGLLLASAGSLSLLWRHRYPHAVVACTALCAAVSLAVDYPVSPLLALPLLVALYELTVHTPERTAYTCGGAVAVLVVLAALVSDHNDEPWTDEAIPPAFWILLTLLCGSAVRSRRAYLEAVRARAEHAERTREEEARHRVAEERIRIARELHDVVAHHMALANAQANTAAHLTQSRPGQAKEILNQLTNTTAAALRELQATVGLLRQEDDPEDPLEPAPGLGRLPELVAAFASAGLQVTVTVDGRQRPLPSGVDLTAFRIVQEALTNVAKHAGASSANVALSYAHDQLTLTVSDEGVTAVRPPTPGGGFGLIGMRERARSTGGNLKAGHRPEGGFAVTAELPLAPMIPEGPR